MSTTSAPAALTIYRTFESFDIVWARGSRWTSYDSAVEAQAIIDHAATIDGQAGTVERRTWEIKLHPELLARGNYNPGIGDRVEGAVCGCPTDCDCVEPDHGFMSPHCPHHNACPIPDGDCLAEVHDGGQTFDWEN